MTMATASERCTRGEARRRGFPAKIFTSFVSALTSAGPRLNSSQWIGKGKMQYF
jgi:hypothetical protein